MQHCDYKPDFRVPAFPELIFDESLVKDDTTLNDLARFVVTFYEDVKAKYPGYQNLITSAIRNGNLEALETLWKGIYYHDRDNPDYVTDFYSALEFGNLRTVQHVLYACLNYRTLNYIEISYPTCLETATKNDNPEILAYVKNEETKALIESVN